MIMKLLGKIPAEINIAFSGGVDSVVIAHFLMQSKRDIKLLHFNHGTDHADEAEEFTYNFSLQHGLPLITVPISNYPPNDGQSKEEYWRDCRYEFLDSAAEVTKAPVITCHHLDDQVETWVFSSMHNYPKLIPYKRNNVIRPFLLVSKHDIYEYGFKHHLGWVKDPSNDDVSYPRNRIRHNIIPEMLKVNPGLRTVIARKVQEEYHVKED